MSSTFELFLASIKVQSFINLLGFLSILEFYCCRSQAADPAFADKSIFPDLDQLDGPLKSYRAKSSFDWRKLRLMIEDEESWKLRYKVWNFVQENPLFARTHETLPVDEQRRLATKKMFTLFNEKFYGIEEYLARPDLSGKFNSAMISYDPSTSVKLSLAFGMFPNTLRTLGSERIMSIVGANQNMENVGCFALTEIAHGSNSRGMRTTATYDLESKSFIMHTPDFEAAKCWVGNLGKTATHAIVYAQLYTPDGKCHGLNAFVVPVRDPKTMLSYPGVTVGDLGEKIGLNGIDNGFGEIAESFVVDVAYASLCSDVQQLQDPQGLSALENRRRRRFWCLRVEDQGPKEANGSIAWRLIRRSRQHLRDCFDLWSASNYNCSSLCSIEKAVWTRRQQR